MSSDKPESNFFLVSEIIPKYLETTFAISEFLGHKIVESLFLGDKFLKSGFREDIFKTKKQFRFKYVAEHFKIACI